MPTTPPIHTRSGPEINVFRKRHEGINSSQCFVTGGKGKKKEHLKGWWNVSRKSNIFLCTCKIHWQWLFWLIGFILLNKKPICKMQTYSSISQISSPKANTPFQRRKLSNTNQFPLVWKHSTWYGEKKWNGVLYFSKMHFGKIILLIYPKLQPPSSPALWKQMNILAQLSSDL